VFILKTKDGAEYSFNYEFVAKFCKENQLSRPMAMLESFLTNGTEAEIIQNAIRIREPDYRHLSQALREHGCFEFGCEIGGTK
jgi:hypothetical protein